MGDATDGKHAEPEVSMAKDDELAESETAERTADDEREVAGPTTRAQRRRSDTSQNGALRWVALAGLILALGSLGVSLWLLLRPAPVADSAASPTPSSQQVADAKAKACGAYTTVRAAVTFRSNADPGPDLASVGAEVVSVNARMALTVSSSYLRANLDAATPPTLADAVRKFTDQADAVAINALAGVNTDDPAQAARLQDLVALDGQFTELCK